ncbi:hypothetical protein GWO43_24480 [candidate division KSB1 bacterium]|nr:hypothetical protein [candidate division KSB1 bacterium]NIR69055.1 hypothetical protein [candidate division KSB1 bacterium]NIS25623.1 hypothetical protein [candidate division KSB1 bacterium]NIT73973.1 hypothetical protein [candidate division KSB1 bacterium]NIU26300.1 hypothetical protein [candidate division KSB1 bacterium]
MTNLLRKVKSLGRKASRQAVVGLALGGGGVRGLAHVGVLSVFQRAAIPVKAIAGSSMGAIVGVAYALNPDFSKEFMAKQMADLGLSVQGGLLENGRDKESFVQKIRQFIDTERFIVDAMLGWGILPETRILESLRRLMLGKRLEETQIAIAVVATDLLSGDKIVFREGPADFAIQASSALPGFLPPVDDQDRLLADGAFIDLIPTTVVRDLGADFVIAVDVDQEGLRVEVHNGLEAFLRAVDLCARHHKRHHLESADLVIRPDFDQAVKPLDFSKAELCIEAGEQAAEQMLPELREQMNRQHSLSKTASTEG